MTWITPLSASMSTAVTVASLTMTVSPSTVMVTSAPFTVATVWPSRVTTWLDGTSPATTW